MVLAIYRSIQKFTKELNNIVSYGVTGFYSDRQYTKFVLLPRNPPNFLKEKSLIATINDVDDTITDTTRYHDREDYLTYKRDRLKFIPLAIFLTIPFSTFGLPFYFKYLPNILPRSFSTRETKVELYKKQLNRKRENCTKLINCVAGLKQSIVKLVASTGITSIHDIKYTMISNLSECHTIFPTKNNNQLNSLSELLGLSSWIPNTILVDKLFNIPSSQEIDSKLVLLEIKKESLTYEDLQDILFRKSIEFSDQQYTYQQLLDKALKYNQLVMEIKENSGDDNILFIRQYIILQTLILDLHL
ncbi:hypothetical protein CYY_002379 [Polysphondylium violaceum]|uniref:Letm1 RBD domain-containing protein n=1 Tax=Polysphondylium violaceum TaxID=133409 RepID=A0A8J4PWS2_9MYCE|nr:hypothetical protein CYY_002379 [Polysphondylium violaceum]